MTHRPRRGKRNKPQLTQAQRIAQHHKANPLPPPQPLSRPTMSVLATAIKVGLIMQAGDRAKR